MKRRKNSNHLLALSFLLICAILITSCSSDKQPPNVIFILVDDLGWKDLSCYGSEYYQTPHVDELAKNGVTFTHAYAASSVCSPTRASILTGKYPATLHLTDFIPGKTPPNAKYQPPQWKKFLDTTEVTMAELFKSQGYVTAHIGKWHLGNDSIYWPEHQGFDSNIGGWSRGAPFQNKQKGFHGYFSPYGNPKLQALEENEYLTERLTLEAKKFITQNKNKPFFLNFWLYAVHTPLQAKADKIDKYRKLSDSTKLQKNEVYAAMIEHMDEAVGTIQNTLRELKIDQNTLIVFTSDNGGLVGNHPRFQEAVTSNFPLRSGKGDVYEGGIRVPCILYYPKKIQPSVEETPIISLDFLPTLIDLADIPRRENPQVEGISLAPLVTKKEPLAERPLFWHYPHYHTEGAVPHSVVRFQQYKLIHNLEDNELELYDLNKDIGESNNLINEEKKIAQELFQMLQEWKLSVKAQAPIKNPNFHHHEETTIQ